MPDKPKQIYDERGEFIDDELARLEKQLSAIQTELLELLVVDYASEFGDVLTLNQANLKKLYELTPIFEQMAEITGKLETKVAKDLLKLTEYSSGYFNELGLKVSNIKKQLSVVYDMIGITKEGTIVANGYLSKLFSTTNQLLQQDISNYVLESLAGGRSHADFVKGFKELIKGNPEIDGKLMRYYKTYVNDIYSKMARISDNYLAEELGLDLFVYDGTAIKTSRPFCQGGHDKYLGNIPSKIMKVFTRAELHSWNDLEWQGKDKESTTEVSLGGINCRHIARWITEDYARELGYNPEESTETGFKEAKTIKEAEEFAKQFTTGKVSYNGLDINIANQTNRALNDNFKNSKMPKFSEIKSLPLKSNSYAQTSIAGNELYINTKTMGSIKKFDLMQKESLDAKLYLKNKLNSGTITDVVKRAEIERLLSFERQLVGKTPYDMVTHEIGHNIDFQLFVSKEKEIRDIVFSNIPKYVKNISSYASSPIRSEYIAESFVLFKNGGSKLLDPDLVNLFKKYGF